MADVDLDGWRRSFDSIEEPEQGRETVRFTVETALLTAGRSGIMANNTDWTAWNDALWEVDR